MTPEIEAKMVELTALGEEIVVEHCAHEGGVIQVGEQQLTEFTQDLAGLTRKRKQEYCCYCDITRWRGEAIRPTKKHGPYLRPGAARAYAIVETAEWSKPCPVRKEQA